MYLAIVCISLCSGSIGAFLFSRFGHQSGFTDSPSGRSSHSKPTPKGGGIGILVGFTISAIICNISWTFWMPALFVSVVSLWGDKTDLSPKLRLIVQFACAGFLIYNTNSDVFYGALTSPHFNLLEAVPILFCFVFIVGTANFYNFMDGINGIAAITGIIAFSLLSFYAFWNGKNVDLIVINIAVACGCLGFLPFNWPNARVFMGDVGSVVLGFIFAGMVVLISRDLLEFIVLCSFLFMFYADELVTLAERILNGDRITQPHRKHLYQVLANEFRIKHWKISMGYGICQLIVGLSIWGTSRLGFHPTLIILMLFSSIFFLANWRIKERLNEY